MVVDLMIMPCSKCIVRFRLHRPYADRCKNCKYLKSFLMTVDFVQDFSLVNSVAEAVFIRIVICVKVVVNSIENSI